MPSGPSKLIVVIASLSAGGAERVCVNLCNFWVREGRSVELVILRQKGLLQGLLDSRVSCTVLGASRTATSLGKLAFYLRRTGTVPVLAFGVDVGAVLAAMKRIRLIANPIIYREGSSPRHKKIDWVYRHLIGGVDGIIAATKATRQVLYELMPAPPPVVLLCPNPGDPRMSAAPAAGVPPPTLHLLAVGRLEPVKGYTRLLRAFQKLQRLHPGATLTIAGDGSEAPHLREEIKALALGQTVRLAGFVEDVNPLYEQAGIVVMSSLYEGQPNALYEAILRGKLVVASGGDTVRELLATLGLVDCFVDDAGKDFAEEFCATLQRALVLEPGRREQAARIWREETRFARVAGLYWDFCQSVQAGSGPTGLAV